MRAAEWYRRRGDIETAARYLLEAHDWQQLLELVVAQGPAILRNGRRKRRRRLDRAGASVVAEGSGRHRALEAAGRAVGGDVNRADAVLARLEGLQPMLAEEHAVTELLRAYCAIQRGALREGTVPRRAGAARRRPPRRGPDPEPAGADPVTGRGPAGANLIRGIGLVYEGLFDDARRSLEPVVAAGHAFWDIGPWGPCGAQAWSGALRAAETAGTAAVSLAGQLGLDHQAVSADAYLARRVALRAETSSTVRPIWSRS